MTSIQIFSHGLRLRAGGHAQRGSAGTHGRGFGGDRALRDARRSAAKLLTLQLDLARHLHAAAVQHGLLPRSMLESQRFERRLIDLERLALGPLARRV